MEMWFSEFHTPDVKHSIRVNRQLYSKQSDYQRIDIFETPEFGRVLTLDGNVMLTERDEFIYDEMITHVPMSVHKNAKDILVIGAGDGGVVRELTRYDRVERIDLVEMDPQVIEACRAYLPGNACRMDDRRVHIYYENALKFIRKCEDEYDLIIVDSSDPFDRRRGCSPANFTAAAIMPCGQTASWSTSRAARFMPRTPPPCSAATSELPAPFLSARCIRRTSRPLRRGTGCSALPAKNIIPSTIWTPPHGTH